MIRWRNGGAGRTFRQYSYNQASLPQKKFQQNPKYEQLFPINKEYLYQQCSPAYTASASDDLVKYPYQQETGIKKVMYPQELTLRPMIPGTKSTKNIFYLSDYMRKISASYNTMSNILYQEWHLLYFGVGNPIRPGMISLLSWSDSLGIVTPKQISEYKGEDKQSYALRRDLTLLSKLMSPYLLTAREKIGLYVDLSAFKKQFPQMEKGWPKFFRRTSNGDFVPKKNIVTLIKKYLSKDESREFIKVLKTNMRSKRCFQDGSVPDYFDKKVRNFFETCYIYMSRCYMDENYKNKRSLHEYISDIVYSLARAIYKSDPDSVTLSDEQWNNLQQGIKKNGLRRMNDLDMNLKRYYGILSKTNECPLNDPSCLKNIYLELIQLLKEMSQEFLPHGIPVSPSFYNRQLIEIQRSFQGSMIKIRD